MQSFETFLNAGWDFMEESANGTEDIWWILEGRDYPRSWWERAEGKRYAIDKIYFRDSLKGAIYMIL